MTTMNYILQSKKKNSFNQLLQGILNFYREPQAENTDTVIGKVVDVILKAVVTFLFVLATSGIAKIVFELITNPSQFSNATFGVFDYL